MESTAMTKLANRVAIVTGAGRGQGAAEARMLAAAGAAVLICDVLEEEGSELARSLEHAGC
jgi:3alpha(or 20beta)-hydroxysteroid dehydrogenase